MGKATSSRDWAQIYMIYGLDEWQTFLFLLIHSLIFSLLSILLLIYLNPFTTFLTTLPIFTLLPPGSPRLTAGLLGSIAAITSACLATATCHFLYSAIPLRWDISQRMLAAVSDWSAVRSALDVGCGRGILLNAVAMQLKKQGSSGHVVGLDKAMWDPLRTATVEGVQEYVTCREGDVRRMPFRDDCFDVVVSAAAIRRAGGKEERERVVGEVVRVLKPGGIGVVWDLQHVPEYVRKLREMRMEEIRVSERVTAYLVSSHIVSFRKPSHQVGPACIEVQLDWR